MLAIKHTIFRSNNYYFNLRITTGMYRKSLRSDSPKLVKKYVSCIKEFLDKGMTVTKSALDDFIDMLITNQVNEVVRLAEVVTKPLSNAAKNRFRSWYSNVEGAIDYNYNSQSGAIPSGAITIPDLKYPAFEETIAEALVSNRYCALITALSTYDEEGGSVIDDTNPFYDDFLYPTKDSEYYGYLSSTVKDHATNMSTAILEKNYKGLREEINELSLRFAELLPEPLPKKTAVTVHAPEIKSPYFADIKEEVKSFIESSGNHSITTSSNYIGKFQWFLPVLGGYKLSDITEDILEEVWNNLRALPKREFYTHYFEAATPENKHGKVVAEIETIWNQFDSKEEELEVAAEHKVKSYKDYLALLKAIFDWADRKNYLLKNPVISARLATSGNSIPRVELPAPYPEQIINHCMQNLGDPISFAVLLLAFHGFRNSEIICLTSKDVITDSTGVTYIEVKKGKTKNAKRRVPIHKKVVKAGFLKYVDTKDGNLFELKSSDLTSMFNTYRVMFSIPKYNERGERLNLYSLRHNVVTQLQYMNNCKDHHVYALVGHAPKGSEITFNYTSPRYLELQTLINQVNYD